MKRIVTLLVAIAALSGCGQASSTNTTAPASDVSATTMNNIEIGHAWASPTPGGTTTSAGYLTIPHHAATADTLLAATSTRANSVDVHTMRMENGMMEMRPAGDLPIPPGGTLTLAPNSLHLMFNGVTAPFTEGETIPVTLHFDRGGDI